MPKQANHLRTVFPWVALVVLWVVGIARASAAPDVEDLSDLLEPIRAAHDLPALAGSIVAEGRTIAIGATGERARDGGDPVSVEDRWHLGSCAKAMTSTLAAILVEEGLLSWDTTLGEVFPDETEDQPAWQSVTLEQLLRHRSGLPDDREAGTSAWFGVPLEGPLREQRLEVVRAATAKPPEFEPGIEMHYANAGFVIAGAMLEARTGESWEDLIRKRLFDPLGMKSAGFGPPRPLPEPEGHWQGAPLGAGPRADNPPVLGPAGTVHANLEDWGKFVALHLAAAKGDTRVLPKTSFVRLHTPTPGGDHAMGWFVLDREWGGRVLTHLGTNRYWYAVVWASPERGFAVLVATNEAGEHAPAAIDAAAAALIQHHQADR